MMHPILVSTTHNLKVDMWDLTKSCNVISEMFQHVYIAISDVSDLDISSFISNNSLFDCVVIPARGAADARRKALSLALSKEGNDAFYFYCDFDKIIAATLNQRQNFENFFKSFDVSHQYLIIGRNEESFATFPNTWKDTERISNYAASEVFKINNLDITAGCCAFNGYVGETIIKESREKLTDTEWPLICKRCGISVEYKDVAFLSYVKKITYGKDDDNWRGYIPRLTLALRAVKSLNTNLSD